MANIAAKGRGKWLVRVFLGRDGAGQQLFHSKVIHGTKRDAENYAAEKTLERDRGALTVKPKAVVTMNELFDDLMLHYRRGGNAYGREVQFFLRKHLRPAMGALSVSQLTTHAINAYIDAKLDEGLAKSTINRHLSAIRTSLKLAAEESSPPKISSPIRFKQLDERGNEREGFWTQEEFEAMFEALPAHVQPILTVAYYTGMRRGEILRLKWSQYEVDAGILRVCRPKNKKIRNVPLHRAAVSLLRVRRAIHDRVCPDCESIMFNESLGRGVRAFHGAWAKAANACGVHRLFHDLRRTGARNLRRAGVDEKTVMEIGGWKTRDTFLRYNIIDEQDLIEARDKLESQMPAFDPLKKLMAG